MNKIRSEQSDDVLCANALPRSTGKRLVPRDHGRNDTRYDDNFMNTKDFEALFKEFCRANISSLSGVDLEPPFTCFSSSILSGQNYPPNVYFIRTCQYRKREHPSPSQQTHSENKEGMFQPHKARMAAAMTLISHVGHLVFKLPSFIMKIISSGFIKTAQRVIRPEPAISLQLQIQCRSVQRSITALNSSDPQVIWQSESLDQRIETKLKCKAFEKVTSLLTVPLPS